ncbi:MAG: sugar transferase [Planctomycetes bacterium]|nr:sugar transferase [Planctomycetota bacterium]
MPVLDQATVVAAIGDARQHPILPPVSPYFRWKGWVDRTWAALLLVPGLPVIALLVAVVRLTSRGPGIFAQVRVGAHGRRFTMYKIRTMRVDAEASTGAVWCKENDPRITPLGNLLRKLHLDELPQLFNVLRGEMSLVGPRPERPEFVNVLAKAIPNYRHRHAIAPGVTGLAQVNLPPDTDLESVRKKLHLDLEYVRAGSLLLDLRLLATTLLRLIGIRSGRAVRLLGLEREVPSLACSERELRLDNAVSINAFASRLHDLDSADVATESADLTVREATGHEETHSEFAVDEVTSSDATQGTPDSIARALNRRPR